VWTVLLMEAEGKRGVCASLLLLWQIFSDDPHTKAAVCSSNEMPLADLRAC